MIPQSEWVRVYRDAKRNAVKRRIDFDLSIDEFWAIEERAGGRCELSAMPFSLDKPVGALRRPYAPSLDRPNSRFGYTNSNCRLVCVIANYAKNEWGDDVLVTWIEHMLNASDAFERQRRERQQKKELQGIVANLRKDAQSFGQFDGRCYSMCSTGTKNRLIAAAKRYLSGKLNIESYRIPSLLRHDRDGRDAYPVDALRFAFAAVPGTCSCLPTLEVNDERLQAG